MTMPNACVFNNVLVNEFNPFYVAVMNDQLCCAALRLDRAKSNNNAM